MRAIDADALIEKLDAEPEGGYYSPHDVISLLMAQPVVEERKTGEWIIQDNPGTGWYRVVCSECDENVTSNIPMIGFFPHCKPLWDYCPYCGADMRGKQNDSISD